MNNNEKEFSEAMKVKLNLNRKKRQENVKQMTEQPPKTSLRSSIAQKVVQQHPGLTQEEVEQMMERDGF